MFWSCFDAFIYRIYTMSFYIHKTSIIDSPDLWGIIDDYPRPVWPEAHGLTTEQNEQLQLFANPPHVTE